MQNMAIMRSIMRLVVVSAAIAITINLFMVFG